MAAPEILIGYTGSTTAAPGMAYTVGIAGRIVAGAVSCLPQAPRVDHKGALKGVLHHLGRFLLWILPELGEIAMAAGQAGLPLNPEAQFIVTVLSRLAVQRAIDAGQHCHFSTPGCTCLTNEAAR